MSNKTNQIFITSLDDIDAFCGLLPADELRSAEQYRHPRRRRQFLAGRALLRLSLDFAFGMPAMDFKLATKGGKPFLADPGKPIFSLSHSGKWVGCLISQGDICGFDLQIRSKRPVGDIAELFFHPGDRQWIQGQSEFDLAFYELCVVSRLINHLFDEEVRV